MFNPAYRIVTPRLVIRCYNPSDAFLLAKSVTESLEHLLPWMPWAAAEPEPLDNKIERLKKARANFDMNNDYMFGIFSSNEDVLVGSTGLHTRLGTGALEVGYWIHKDYTNKGYATEAASALTKIAFENHEVERVEIHCSVKNLPSAAVPKKLGYTHEATLRNRSLAYGEPSDQMLWSLFKAEYPQSPASKLQFSAYDAIERQIL